MPLDRVHLPRIGIEAELELARDRRDKQRLGFLGKLRDIPRAPPDIAKPDDGGDESHERHLGHEQADQHTNDADPAANIARLPGLADGRQTVAFTRLQRWTNLVLKDLSKMAEPFRQASERSGDLRVDRR